MIKKEVEVVKKLVYQDVVINVMSKYMKCKAVLFSIQEHFVKCVKLIYARYIGMKILH